MIQYLTIIQYLSNVVTELKRPQFEFQISPSVALWAISFVCYLAKFSISSSMLLVSFLCLSVCLFVCLSVCLFTLYRSQFWSKCFQIFFLDMYPPWLEQVPIWCKSGNGIRSKKIPENPQNPYLSSLRKFQSFISPSEKIPKISYLQETCIGPISTLKKSLTLKKKRSRSWQGQMWSNFNAL